MIDIASALRQSLITHENGEPKNFSIEYVTQEGKAGKIDKARRFVKDPITNNSSSSGNSARSLYNLKKNGCILVYDDVKKQHRSIKIDRITKFNGLTVRH